MCGIGVGTGMGWGCGVVSCGGVFCGEWVVASGLGFMHMLCTLGGWGVWVWGRMGV